MTKKMHILLKSILLAKTWQLKVGLQVIKFNQSRFLSSALLSAYVLMSSILQTIWAQIRLLSSGALWSGLIMFDSMIKSSRK